MLTAKLFGTRKSTAAPTAAPIAAISDTVLANNQYESDKGKGKKIRKKTRNPPSFSLRHIRSPSSQGDKSSRRSTQAVNENKSTWTSSVLRRFSKRRQLKSDAAELFDSNTEFDHLSIPRHIRANTMVEITNLSNPSLVPSINNAASAPACTCKKPDTSSSRRWTRLSWPWQLGAPSPPPPPPPPPQASASASPPGLCALHSPISSPAVSIRARHAPTLADFLLPSEMARLRHMEPPLDECDAREEQDEEEVEGEHYSYEMNEEDGHDTNSWPDFRDHASNSIREWVASIPKETPLSLANFALPVNDGPGTSTAPTRPISTSRRLCAIAPETAESDFTTTDATANDEYRYGPWADHESESSIGDELSMIESFGEDLLEQPGYNTSFGIRISPENVLGLVSNLLERGALDDLTLPMMPITCIDIRQQQLSSYPNRRRYSRGSNYSAASNGNNGYDRHSDLLTWQEENPSNPTPEHVYCT
ncbi:hypothetical protein BDF22DRAFT_681492 [Syncephalis plumigaleata]|nr:hypothetical protein BDF22DRAFT_681492 [Syncephalis plumigaleata]